MGCPASGEASNKQSDRDAHQQNERPDRKGKWPDIHSPFARGGTLENRMFSPSDINGCEMIASRTAVYGSLPSIAICTAVTTSPALVPSMEKPRIWSECAST